jgi:hypothetical protein
MSATSDTLVLANGSASSEVGYTPGSWHNIEAEYHAASHRLRVGSNETSGSGVGTNNASAIGIFANAAGSNACNVSISALLIAEGTPSAGFLSWWRSTWIPWLSSSVIV